MAGSGYRSQGWRRGPRRFSRRLVVYVIEVLALAGVLGGGAYAFYEYVQDSEHFRVKTVRVMGADFLKEEDILDVSGVTSADNVLFLDVAAVRERVAAMPYVRRCRVTRGFPDMVVITVEERVGVATVLVDNRSFVVDRDCVVLRELIGGEPPEGPFITNVPDLGFVAVGQHLSQPVLGQALAVWEAFSGVSMAEEVTVSEISWSHENGMRMYRMYCDGLDYEIRWGRDDFASQALFLEVLWRAKGGDIGCHEYVDLRFGNHVACK